MVSEIVEILHELNIVDYNIYDEHRKAFEMYFVKHRLDMTRDKEVREIRLRFHSRQILFPYFYRLLFQAACNMDSSHKERIPTHFL